MSDVLANYHEQRNAFRALFEPDCCKRILLFKGASGSGKTSLLDACLEEEYGGLPPVKIQLRGDAVTVSEIFSRSARRIGWGNLAQFRECARTLAGQPTQVSLNGIDQQGESNYVNIALNLQDPGNRLHHQTLLTDAWFDDVQRLGKPLVVVGAGHLRAGNQRRAELA